MLSPRFKERAYRLLFTESAEPFASEIIGYTNGGISLTLFLVLVFATPLSWGPAVAIALAVFVLLRLALENRIAIWIAAVLGTAFVTGVGAAIGWTFGHVFETNDAPIALGIASAVMASVLPLVAYRRFILRRNEERESLLPPSVPSHP
jgi:hypothetical protein